MARSLSLSQSAQEHEWLKNELGGDKGLCTGAYDAESHGQLLHVLNQGKNRQA